MLVSSLDVESFRIISQARLTFGRGLNVLFGPNDLGKSSLLDALRAAFLLPFASKEGEQYIGWADTNKPRVVVQFETGGAMWKITKEFGTGARGISALERIGEGRIPLERINGRAVEEKLREILAWGIPPGQRRGLTETYLATALLGHQHNVTQILATNMENDGSGRDILTKALGALGQDPLVSRLFKDLEKRYEEAFSPTGAWKKNGPVARRTRQIEEQKNQLKELEERVGQSKGIEQRVVLLTERMNRAIEDCCLLQRRLESLQKLKQAEEDVNRLRAVEDARRALESIENDLADKKRVIQAAILALEKLEIELRNAADRLAKASGALDEIRKSAEQMREARRVEFSARRDKSAARVQLARDVMEAAQQVDAIAKTLVEAKDERTNREAQLRNAEWDREKAEIDLENEEAILARAQKDAAQKQILRASLDPAKIACQNASQRLSNAKRVIHLSQELRKEDEAHTKLQEEERNLEVELQANAVEKGRCETNGPRRQPLPILPALVAVLIGGIAATALGVALQFRTIPLVLSILGCAVFAGALTVSILWFRKHQKAKQTWHEQVIGLEKDRQQVVERKNQVSLSVGIAQVKLDNLRLQRDQLTASVDNLTLEQAQEGYQETKREVERIETELQTFVRGLIPVEKAEGNVGAAKKAVCQSQRELDDSRNVFTKAQGRAEILEVQLSNAKTNLEQLAAKIGKRLAEQVLAEAEQEREQAEKALTELEEAPHSEVEVAEREFKQSQEEVARLEAEVGAMTAVEAASQAQEQARTKRDVARVNYQTLLQSSPADKEVKAAEEALSQVRIELEETTAPGLPKNLEETKTLLTQRQAELRKAENDLHVAQGELNQVGGTVAREQRDQEREALEHLEISGNELELEFRAIKRLLEILREEEAKHGADLGRCLSKPVTEAFLQFTNSGRYSQVAFEPGLCVQNLAANGGNLEWGSLSVGTRDQLATLIRVTLAAQLKSAVVLDDQLAQSDPERLVWFRERLRASVRDHGHQIIVITCRPFDYLHPHEMPDPSSAKFQSEDGLLTVVDLKRVVS